MQKLSAAKEESHFTRLETLAITVAGGLLDDGAGPIPAQWSCSSGYSTR